MSAFDGLLRLARGLPRSRPAGLGIAGIALAALAGSAGCAEGPERALARFLADERPLSAQEVGRVRAWVSHPSANVRACALEVLASRRVPDVADTLLAGLRDPEAGVREAAARAAEELREARVFEDLSRLAVEDRDWRVRRRAVAALGTLAIEGASAPVGVALLDSHPAVRQAAARAAAALGREAPVEACARAVAEDPVWEIRAAAAAALGGSERPEAYYTLRVALLDASEFVRSEAAEAIRALVRKGVAEPETIEATGSGTSVGPVAPWQPPVLRAAPLHEP